MFHQAITRSLIFSLVLISCDGFGMMTMMSSSGSTTTSTKPYGVNLKFSIKPDRREEFLSIAKDTQQKALETEPLALQYIFGEDVDTPNTFHIHKQFIGEEGLVAHRKTEHGVNWDTFSNSDPFATDGQPTFDCFYGDHDVEKVPIRSCFGVQVELCIKANLIEDFLDVIRNNQRGSTNDEKLCLQYVWGESTVEKNTFVFHEEYMGDDGGKEGFDAHTQTPHFVAWEKFTEKEPFSRPPVVNFFKTIS